MYLSGLDLRGRRVLVAGGGRVSTRRMPRLLDSGARVEVVSPVVSQAIARAAERGELVWHRRPAVAEDVDGAWYVMVATDDEITNEVLSQRAAELRIFCVRSDDATTGTAWTPAVEQVGDFLIGVLGNRDPRGSIALRRRIVEALTHAPESPANP